MLVKILYDNGDGNGDKKCVRDFNFSATNCSQVFNTRRDSEGEGVGAVERQQGWKAGLCQYEYVWGNLGFIFIFF